MKFLLSVLTILFVSLCASAETYVVCVGIGRYADARVPNLTKTENDAKAIAELYKQGTKNVTVLIGRQATKQNIISALRREFGKARPGDKIIFFFSGHGYKGGFCPFEMRSIPEGLQYNEVVDLMKASKATDKIIFADACYSGAIRQNNTGNQTPNNYNFGNVMFFLSSRAGETSIESAVLAHGYFTKHLLRGLMGAADQNRDMTITAKEIFNYVSQGVIEDTQGRQHPVMWGNFSDNMAVVKYKKKY